MKIKLHHVDFVSRKLTRDLVNCPFLEIRKPKESIAEQISLILRQDIENEMALDERVSELLEAQESDIEFYQADYKQLFWMAKKRMANDYGVILSLDDRFSDISHKIVDLLWEEDYIHYTVDDNKVKNILIASLEAFVKGFEDADSAVHEKLKNYKRKLIAGTDEYDLVFQKLYEEELTRRGII